MSSFQLKIPSTKTTKFQSNQFLKLTIFKATILKTIIKTIFREKIFALELDKYLFQINCMWFQNFISPKFVSTKYKIFD